MSEIVECQSTIIGFTRKKDCIDGYEENYSESKSNLFIDELQGIVLNYMCGSDVWGMLDRARQNAWQAFRTDLAIAMQGVVKQKRRASNGDIGAIQFTNPQHAKTYAGARIYSNVTGGTMHIRSVTLLPAFNGATTLYIYDDYEELFSVEVADCVSKRSKVVPVDLTVALSGNLYVFYETKGNTYVNKLLCSTCGGVRWCFSLDKPCYSQSKDVWTEWIMAGGIEFNDITLREVSPSSKFRGLTIQASFKCDEQRVICDETSDFINNQTDRAIAFAYLYKAGEYFLNEVVGSGEVNRYTLLGADAINNNIEFYNQRYKEMLNFISSNLDYSKVDCYKCHSKYNMRNSLGVQWT
jgi:hypothetical protein